MRCPKCGIENPDDVKICGSCSAVLKTSTGQEPVTQPRTSRLAISSFILSLFSFVAAFIPALCSVVFGISSLYYIKKHKPYLKGKGLAIAGIAISVISTLIFVGLFGFLCIPDAPPIPNDYTVDDLRSAPDYCNKSYELLLALEEANDCNGAPAIGLSKADVNELEGLYELFKQDDYEQTSQGIRENEGLILGLWNKSQNGRDIISQLNTFDEIADLSEPNIAVEIDYLKNIGYLARIYRYYVSLQAELGNDETAVKELVELDSVFRKFSPNARILATKLVCYAVLAGDIFAADFIANNPNASSGSVELLAEHFKPLADKQTTLKNSIIGKYLMAKTALDKIISENPGFKKNPTLKINSTLRLAKNLCDEQLVKEGAMPESQKLSVWPWRYLDRINVSIRYPDDRLPKIYFVYNPVGSLIAYICAPVCDRMFQQKTKLQIHDDMLQVVLNKRLGRTVDLKARAYSDEYLIDLEKGRILSPGPDGQVDTEDDIKLTINPEVLDWVN